MAARDRVCHDGKYVVFKVDDFYEFCKNLWSAGYDHSDASIEDIAEQLVVMDGSVIRRQDCFAPPALDAYANNIRMALSLAPMTTTTKRLREIADYFHEQATLSWQQIRKVPD